MVRPREILIDGKTPGTISLIVWGADTRVQYDIVVEQPDLVARTAAASAVSRRGDPGLGQRRRDHPLRHACRAPKSCCARPKSPAPPRSKPNVINMLQVPGAAESQQVMLQVRFAEVNRRALTDAGVSFFTSALGYKNWIGRTTTQQFPAPEFEDDQLVFSDFLNLFLFNTKYNVGALSSRR